MTNDRQPPPEGHWPRRLWRTGPALALAIGLAMALVACGGSSSDEGSSAGVIQADDLAQPAEETAPAPSSGAEGPQAAPDTGAATEPDVSATDAATPNADPPSEEAPEPATQEDVFLMFAQCLRDEGLDVDDPDFSAGRGPGGFLRGIDRDDPAVQAALDTCRPLIESARPELSSEEQAELQDSLVAFTTCLRGQGLDVEDPDFSGGGLGGGPGRGGFLRGIDPEDPDTQAAIEHCRDEIPEFGGRLGGGPRR